MTISTETAPQPVRLPVLSPRRRRALASVGWGLASVGLFAGIWEALWAMGMVNPLLLPPPHMFLGDIPGTLTFFDQNARIGRTNRGSGSVLPLITTMLWTTTRVVLGLFIGFSAGVAVGALVHYVRLLRNLLLPTILLLAPISPVAWLPVAIFVFGTTILR